MFFESGKANLFAFYLRTFWNRGISLGSRRMVTTIRLFNPVQAKDNLAPDYIPDSEWYRQLIALL